MYIDPYMLTAVVTYFMFFQLCKRAYFSMNYMRFLIFTSIIIGITYLIFIVSLKCIYDLKKYEKIMILFIPAIVFIFFSKPFANYFGTIILSKQINDIIYSIKNDETINQVKKLYSKEYIKTNLLNLFTNVKAIKKFIIENISKNYQEDGNVDKLHYLIFYKFLIAFLIWGSLLICVIYIIVYYNNEKAECK